MSPALEQLRAAVGRFAVAPGPNALPMPGAWVYRAELAKAREITTAQLALAWVLSRGPHVIAIPGTRKLARLQQNARAAEIKLSDAELQRLDTLAPLGVAAGERYDARGMSSLNG